MELTKKNIENCINDFTSLAKELIKGRTEKLLTGYDYEAKQLIENFSKTIQSMNWLAESKLNKERASEPIKAEPRISIELKKSLFTSDDVLTIENNIPDIDTAINELENLTKSDKQKKEKKIKNDIENTEDESILQNEKKKKKKKKKENIKEEEITNPVKKSFSFNETLTKRVRVRELQEKHGIY